MDLPLTGRVVLVTFLVSSSDRASDVSGAVLGLDCAAAVTVV